MIWSKYGLFALVLTTWMTTPGERGHPLSTWVFMYIPLFSTHWPFGIRVLAG